MLQILDILVWIYYNFVEIVLVLLQAYGGNLDEIA